MVDIRELIQKVSQAKNKLELQNLKTQFLGKNSQINQEFKKLGSLSEEEKKIKASSLNNEKQKITEAINNRFKELEKLETNYNDLENQVKNNTKTLKNITTELGKQLAPSSKQKK